MRCALAVPALTACLVLIVAATCPAQQYRAPDKAEPKAALVLPEPPAAPPIPEPPARPDAARGADAPPPFMQRPVANAQAPRPDMTFAVRPAPVNFRGLAWGTPLPKVEGLTPVTKPVALPGTYYRPDELLHLGQAEIRSVAYYFPKGALTGVGIVFEGQDNFFLIKDHLIELYGPGRQMGDRYGWTWSNFFIDLRLRGATGELRYTHQP
ncbi:MAG: hypothetical protein Q7U56_01580 [Humidesulfovibrio sp.]|nr:hypothetical protein [Humidesulfovibrio sp.]